jgi:hypothetical protein
MTPIQATFDMICQNFKSFQLWTTWCDMINMETFWAMFKKTKANFLLAQPIYLFKKKFDLNILTKNSS